MSTIDTRIDPFTKSPNRQQPATFSEDMDTRLAEENSRIVQMNDMSDEMNVVVGEVNDNAIIASDKADEASNSAEIARGFTNYKGIWIPNYNVTGYSLNESVVYGDGFNYVSNIDNNLVEPTSGVNTPEWNWVETINPADYYDKAEADGLLDLKAPIDSPSFTGTQTLPRATISYNDSDRVFTIGTSTADSVYEFVSPDGTVVGKNSNGSYWKYVDGKLVCTSYVFPLNATASTLSSTSVVYPIAFMEATLPSPNILNNNITPNATISFLGTVSNNYSTTGADISINGSITGVWFLKYTAIGRWK